MSDLSRRKMLAGAAATALLPSLSTGTTPKATKLPKALRLGDKIGVITPAGMTEDIGDYDQAVKNLKVLGLEAVFAPNAHAFWGYLGGTDQQRADDVNWCIKNPDLAGIICLKGGYGVTRMLHLIDYAAFEANPKVVSGYSDITALLSALTTKTGVVTFHGPLAQSNFSDFEGEVFRQVVMTPKPIGPLYYPIKKTGRQPSPSLQTIIPGQARGRLVGGNLSLISAMVGSPYLPDFKGAILFLEDVSEHPYRVDRMLTTLYTAGLLDQIAGLVFGDFREPAEEPGAKKKAAEHDFTMLQVMENIKMWLKCPVMCGGQIGHLHDKWTLPIGIEAELDATAKVLSIPGPAVTM